MLRPALSRLRSLWRNLVHRQEVERDLSAEVTRYRELLVAEKVAAGMAPAEARRQAGLEIGSAATVAQEVRDVRTGHALAAFARDVRAAARSLTRGHWTGPVVTALTIGIGVAATTTVFSLMYGVLLRPLALPHPDRLLILNMRYLPESGYDAVWSSISWPEYVDFRDQNQSLAATAALQNQTVSVGPESGDAALVTAQRVSASFFDVVQVAPALGRGFTASDDQPGGPCVAVLSSGVWREQFGSDRALIGKDAVVDGRPCRVVGVMPVGFRFPDARVRVWLPLQADPSDPTKWGRYSHSLLAVGRLRDGVSLERHDADLALLRRRWEAALPIHHRGHFVVSRPLLDTLVGSIRPTLVALFGAVVLLLAGICFNLTALTLMRTEGRRREIAVRLALGSRRGDVVRLALVESGIVAAVGGIIGGLAAWAAGGMVPRLVPGGLPRAEAIVMDGRAVAFAAVVTGFVALVLGLAGGLAAARVRVEEAWQASGSRTIAGSRSARRTRSALVVAQVALGLALSLTALGLIGGYRRLRDLDLGFDGRQVTALSVYLAEGRYPDRGAVWTGYDRILERIAAIPGVVAAGATTDIPLEGASTSNDVRFEGIPDPGPKRGYNAHYLDVSPGYFQALSVPLRDGRLLEAADGPDSPLVAVVNETLVRKFLGGADPIGRRLQYLSDGDPWIRIVGVVGDVRTTSGQPPEPAVYASYRQQVRPQAAAVARSMTLVVRTAGAAPGLVAEVRAAVAAAAPGTPISRVRPMAEVIDAASGSARFAMSVMTGFAATVVLLAALGLYGLLAHAVAARQRETGIRMALGAGRRAIGIAVVRSGLALAALGVVIGLSAALVAAPAISRSLFEIRGSSPVAVLGATGVLLLVAAVASLIPAIRAARQDPRAALAEE